MHTWLPFVIRLSLKTKILDFYNPQLCGLLSNTPQSNLVETEPRTKEIPQKDPYYDLHIKISLSWPLNSMTVFQTKAYKKRNYNSKKHVGVLPFSHPHATIKLKYDKNIFLWQEKFAFLLEIPSPHKRKTFLSWVLSVLKMFKFLKYAIGLANHEEKHNRTECQKGCLLPRCVYI